MPGVYPTMQYRDDLAERRVLVTGANGFVGSHLVERLVEYGSDVVAFVRADGSVPNHLADVRRKITVYRGDLQDGVSVRDAVRYLEGYDEALVFHLGAQTNVGESWRRPYETVRTNVIGTLHLLQAIREEDVDIAAMDVAGSSEQYGNYDPDREEGYRHVEEGVVLDESSPINPESVYGTSKVAADFLAQNFHGAYGIPAITTRMFNNYGPRQSPRCITGAVITQALDDGVVEVGNLSPKRDMCYVGDGVRGHVHAALRGSPGEVYTYGYGENLSMQRWTEMIIRIGEEEGVWRDVDLVQDAERFRPGDSEVEELRVGYEKLHDLTGWEPRVSWEEGLRRTVRWYAENESTWRDMAAWE